MKTLKHIRLINYKHRKDENEEFFVNIDDWIKSPYSCLKARFYIEISSLIVYILQFTKITPNFVSVIYSFAGLLSGILLCFDHKNLIYSGLLIFFLKGVIDWSDGLLARVTRQTSNIGHIIDTWGSHVGYHSLIFGIGFICFNSNNEIVYLYITIVIFIISLMDFKIFSYHQLFYEISNYKIRIKKKKIKKLPKKNFKNFNLNRLKFYLSYFMDDRSRTLDLIYLIIFLEVLNNNIFYTKIILILFLLKKIFNFFGNFIEIIFLKKLKNIV
ncbi:MAG: hypothetical protein CMI74_07855 [Candidatus Pelagibacter sp.]|nr:hypothetical protein [Candidatus Pelagibacter sp.]|tara:strand:- start:2085 stop:2897 length:813 start_codon:yes stop_codon:yes gene_type:complete